MKWPQFHLTRQHLLLLSGFLILIYFPVFLHLDSKPLREWDEARNAINAYEMFESHDLLVKTYDHAPDLWETKPPLLIWLQCAGYRLFGVNELAVRLPSALATFSLFIYLFFFFKRHFNAPAIGVLASLIIATSHGYMFEHCSRTGDHDALLVLFEVLMLFHLYLYLQFKQQHHLIGFSVFLALCIYAKSIACFLFLPGILAYLLLSKQFLSSLKDKKLWLGFIAAIAAGAFYYALREHAAKGYLEAVWQNELFPRYFNTSDTYSYNPRDISFYFRQFYDHQYTYWCFLILPAIIVNEILAEEKLKKFHRYLLIISAGFFIVLSNGTTNSSYLVPLLALLSVIIGMAFYLTGRLFLANSGQPSTQRLMIVLILFGAVFYRPYKAVIAEIMDKTETNTQVQYPYVFRRMEKEMPEVKHLAVFQPSGCNYPLVFYRKIFTEQKHYIIEDIDAAHVRHTPLPVVILEDQLHELKDSNVNYRVLWQVHNSLLIRTGE